ncbi:MAG: 50S ribosomal protein L17 [Deltaproteobacteria bacterium]|nr:50S ribosomal protein L17 [Deltaproteobacteria bacterium]
MRHRKAGKKLNRTGSHRNAMFRNMVTSLFEHGRIQTTDAKAKELRRWADRMVTLAKRGDLHARRQALAVMRDKTVVHKLFEEAVDRFGDRVGGYTNVVKIGRRRGDAAPVSLVELVTPKEKKEQKKKKKKTAKKVTEKAKEKTTAKAKEKAPAKAKEKATAKAKEKATPKKVETEDKAVEKTASEKAKEAVSESAAEPQTKEEEENTEVTEAPEPAPKEDEDKG